MTAAKRSAPISASSAQRHRIRVLFAIGSLAGGGAERQIIEYLAHLSRTTFDPMLYLLSEEGELRLEVPGDVTLDAFSRRSVPPRFNYPGRIFRQQVRDLAAFMDDNDVDVLCTVTFLLTLVGAGAMRLRRRPWVAVDMADPRVDFANSTRRFRWYKSWLLRRAYHNADRTIAVSEGVKEGLTQYFGVPQERIAVVPNFVDLARINRLARADNDVPFQRGRFNVVTAGRLQEQKGHIYLLEAIDQLVHHRHINDVTLHLLGQGPLDAHLKSFAARHDLQRHVVFHGYVKNPIPYIVNADLFCLPSLYEGLPLVLLEALACSTPIVATDCPSGPREVLADGRFGKLVPRGNSAVLADAIVSVMNARDDWRQNAVLGREHVEQYYSARSGIIKLERVLQGVYSAEKC